MKVLILNRPDSETMPGGDTFQMRETRTALEALGVKVDVGFELDPDSRGYDIAHVFNLQRPSETFAQMNACRRHGTPVALSTIIWDRSMWRFDLESSTRWRGLRRFIPYPVLALLYRLRSEAVRRHTLAWRMQRCSIRCADVLLPNSSSEGRFIERHFSVRTRERTRVIPNAANVKLFALDRGEGAADFPGLPKRDFVLQVGRIEPVKNQLALIRALFDKDVPIVLVGTVPLDGEEYYRQCRQLADQRGDVHFLGSVPHDLLPRVYAAARVHALPSFRESPGLVSLEAALMRCNVVTTDQGPTHEYFGSWAWYCSPFDVQSIRRAVLMAMSAPFPEALRERILAEFTWEIAAARTLEAYEWVLSQRRSR